MLFPRIVLQVRVRHERYRAIEDGARRQHHPAVGIKRHPLLKHQHKVAEDKEHGVEDEQGARILFPVLRTAVQAFFEPPKDWQGPVLSIHDPGKIAAQGECNRAGSHQKRNWQQPGLQKHSVHSVISVSQN